LHDSLAGRAQSALSDYLQRYQWDAFVTSTFSRPVHYPRQALERVSKQLFEHPSGRSFLAAEEHYLGGWHVHGLVKWYAPSDITNDYAHVRLSRLGFNRVESLNSVGGVAGYCSKYLLKSQADYDFYGYNWGDCISVQSGVK